MKAAYHYLSLLLSFFVLSSHIYSFQNKSNPFKNNTEESEATSRKEIIERIRKRIETVQGKIQGYENKNSPTSVRTSGLPFKEPKTNTDISNTQNKNREATTPSKKLDPSWHDNSSGIYFLPFIGGSYSPKMQWYSGLGPIDIEHENGYNGGFRFGYGWRYFYLEQKALYFSNTTGGVNLGGYNLDGDISGLSILFGLGFKIPFSEYTNLTFGGGAGGTNQKASYQINSILPLNTNDFLATYFLSTGLEFRPFEHFLLGIHYNWYNTRSSSSFSKQELHAFELSLGYFH